MGQAAPGRRFEPTGVFNLNRLADKIALITGGGSGIGAATGALFCSEGAGVMLVDMNAEGLAGTSLKIREQSSAARVATFVADVADARVATRAVEHALDAFGHLDVLVNNAAMRNYSAISDAEPAEWQAVVGVNLIGVANYCKAALPSLRRAKGASIVNVSSCYAVAARAS